MNSKKSYVDILAKHEIKGTDICVWLDGMTETDAEGFFVAKN